MKSACVFAVFAVILPYNSSFVVHVQRCAQLPSSWILKASGSSITETEHSNVNGKRKSIFTRRLAAGSTGATDKPVETDVIIVTKAVISYDNLTVLSLKEILRDRGLQVSGLKDELKLRLTLDDSKNQITAAKLEDLEADDLDEGIFSSSEKNFLKSLPITDLETAPSNSWVKSSSETAFNDRKFKDQQIQEEQKNIVSLLRFSIYFLSFVLIAYFRTPPLDSILSDYPTYEYPIEFTSIRV